MCNDLEANINLKQLKPSERLFNITARTYSKLYSRARDRVAKKLMNPQIHTIRLYDFRHYYGTTTYEKTKDIVFTSEQMGHCNLKNTMIYVKISRILNMNEQEFTCAVAKNLEEAVKLIEQGFQFVTEFDGAKIFKKRK